MFSAPILMPPGASVIAQCDAQQQHRERPDHIRIRDSSASTQPR